MAPNFPPLYKNTNIFGSRLAGWEIGVLDLGHRCCGGWRRKHRSVQHSLQDDKRRSPPHGGQGHARQQTQQHAGEAIPALYHATKPSKPLRYQPHPPTADEGHLGLKVLHCRQDENLYKISKKGLKKIHTDSVMLTIMEQKANKVLGTPEVRGHLPQVRAMTVHMPLSFKT